MTEPTEGIQAWWKRPNGQAHGTAFRLMEHLTGREKSHRENILINLALYGDAHAKEQLLSGLRHRLDDERLTFNLCKSVVDTSQAEITEIQPRPKLLTSQGDWFLKRKAQSMELMLAGEYARNDVFALKDAMFLDAGKLGTSALKVRDEDGSPCIELVPPGQLIVDPIEGQFGKPRTIMQLVPIDRDIARGWLTKAGSNGDKAITNAPRFDSRRLFPWLPIDGSVDQILMLECWRLPDPESFARPQPGRHIICVESGTVLDEKWDRTSFPFAFYRYDLDSSGFWGRGMVGNLRPLQRELNYVLRKIQECIHLAAGIRYWVQGDSKVNIEKIGNAPGEILRFFGTLPPQPEVTNAVPTQFFTHAEDLIRRGYEQEGVSMLSATSRKPAGIDSGAALREYADVQSGRFIAKTRAFEKAIGVDLARLVIEEKRAIAEAGNDKPTRVKQRRGRGFTVHTMRWKDAALEEKQYEINVFPSSALPNDPAGRTATVESWIAAGYLTQQQGKQLLGFPDLEDFESFDLAPYDAVLEAIETMVEDGEYVLPLPTLDLELAVPLVSAAHLKFTVEGAPEDRLELLLRYLDDVKFLSSQAQSANPQQAAGMQPPAAQQQPAPTASYAAAAA